MKTFSRLDILSTNELNFGSNFLENSFEPHRQLLRGQTYKNSKIVVLQPFRVPIAHATNLVLWIAGCGSETEELEYENTQEKAQITTPKVIKLVVVRELGQAMETLSSPRS